MNSDQRTCLNCGAQAGGPQVFCANCGASLAPGETPASSQAVVPPPAAVANTPPVSGKESLVNFLTSAGRERSVLMAAFIVAIVCLVVPYPGLVAPEPRPSKLIPRTSGRKPNLW